MPADPDLHPLATFIDEQQAAIKRGADACATRCACHGHTVCLRTVHDHDVGRATPHLGYGADSQLIQWVHTDEHGPILTDDQVAEHVATARREHTRQMLADLDLDELRAALAGRDT